MFSIICHVCNYLSTVTRTYSFFWIVINGRFTFNMFDIQAWYARDVVMGRITLSSVQDLENEYNALRAKEDSLEGDEVKNLQTWLQNMIIIFYKMYVHMDLWLWEFYDQASIRFQAEYMQVKQQMSIKYSIISCLNTKFQYYQMGPTDLSSFEHRICKPRSIIHTLTSRVVWSFSSNGNTTRSWRVPSLILSLRIMMIQISALITILPHTSKIQHFSTDTMSDKLSAYRHHGLPQPCS